jgi:hypothetical protein
MKRRSLTGFEKREIISPDGVAVARPQELSGALIVYLHTTLTDIFSYSRATLELLDAYFIKHPPRKEYYEEFLLEEFIPAVGGFLAEVIIRELGGHWEEKQPVLTSTVHIHGNSSPVFREAYNAIYKGRKLVDVYDEIKKSR